jgi:hypothetical protein
MRTITAIAQLTSDGVCAVLYAISAAIAIGVGAAACTHRLGPSLLAALGSLLLAGAYLGYSIWRTYAPPRTFSARVSRSRRLLAG